MILYLYYIVFKVKKIEKYENNPVFIFYRLFIE